MKLQITKRDGGFILAASASMLALAAVGSWLIDDAVLIIVMVLSMSLILFGLFEVYRRLIADQHNCWRNEDYRRSQEYRQVESLLSLFFTIKPDLPLPDTRGWAISPDLLKKITE